MRIDKFLQVSRVLKRRLNAKEACLAGRVEINGRLAKPGSEIKEGDVIKLRWGKKIMEIEVLVVPERNVPASEAKNLYRCLSEKYLVEENNDL